MLSGGRLLRQQRARQEDVESKLDRLWDNFAAWNYVLQKCYAAAVTTVLQNALQHCVYLLQDDSKSINLKQL